jgi:hypothetical protein
MGGAEAARSHAQRHHFGGEHGEDGEHQTFPGASTVARLAQVEGQAVSGSSGFSRCRCRRAFSRHRGRNLA